MDDLKKSNGITVFTQGKILSPLLNFAFPILVASFLQALYGAVDLLVVGQFSLASDISAVATGSGIMQTVTVVFIGISMGTTIILGQKIGEGRKDEAGNIIGSSIAMFILIAFVVTVLMMLSSSPIATLMHAPPQAFKATVDYIRICSAGCVFIVFYNLLGSIFRGIGDSKMPLMTVAISAVLNIGFDLLLVAGFKMAAKGAAIATIFSQAVSVLLSVLIIKRKGLPFNFDRSKIRFDKKIIKRILNLGFPVALQDLLVSLSFLVIAAIVNSLGVTASAAVGIAEKVCSFIMLIPSSFGAAMSAFVAQNIGAREVGRANKALKYGILVSLFVGVLVFYLVFFHGNILSRVFTSDPLLIKPSWDYLKAYAIDCILVSILFCSTGYFNGCGKTRFVMIEGIIGAFCIRIPVAFLVSRAQEVSLFYVGLSTPCATIVQITICLIYLKALQKQLKS